MKLFVLFLLGAFVLGGRSFGRERPDRPWLILGVCVLLCAAFYTYRFS